MGATSYSSTVRNGGKSLRLAYPIHGKNTFKPSGDPVKDEPEVKRLDDLDLVRRVLGTQTRAGMLAFDRKIAHIRGVKGLSSVQETAYWDRVRFLQLKSPRARKRAEDRERRAHKPQP